ERLFFSYDEPRTKPLALIQIPMGEVLDGRALLDTFLAHFQITIIAVAIDKFSVLMHIVRLVNQLPGCRRKIDYVIAFGAVVGVILSQRVWTRSCRRAECRD